MFKFLNKREDREFLWGQLPEHRENFVEKIARLSEDSPVELTRHEIEHQMASVYYYPHTITQMTINTALREFEDNLERYNRKLIPNFGGETYTIKKNVEV